MVEYHTLTLNIHITHCKQYYIVLSMHVHTTIQYMCITCLPGWGAGPPLRKCLEWARHPLAEHPGEIWGGPECAARVGVMQAGGITPRGHHQSHSSQTTASLCLRDNSHTSSSPPDLMTTPTPCAPHPPPAVPPLPWLSAGLLH